MKISNKEEFVKVSMFGIGAPNDGFAQYFSGASFLNPLTEYGKCPVFLANVTFEPGCRNNWHIHHADKGGGQILVCTAGKGWYQEWGKPAQELNPGDVVYIASGIKHFHGSQKDSWFSHIAVECPGENCSNGWLEPVTDEQYDNL
ncbi:cupin domain-containing protein [Cellulosilyticum lentocellum]|uniref:Cupin 2 conserved barrel domain protein n=1 Tax=Cellulosilyticum lentocellum (strain ATCC 49066 / DSM 5427 / NCIMB 11756 / RHM5) TaxID=642492 RepID=F2JPV5_CELLD|nr:AraC family ligand binding domain-containing protein [Cellulosilyticum lentocellum]ADZ84890.1 Cupin 2 conserved barrel domain protein [Cellulosilyticum lentocellum DSM 5427]